VATLLWQFSDGDHNFTNTIDTARGLSADEKVRGRCVFQEASLTFINVSELGVSAA
jgi:hypothetical protein